MDQQCTVYKPRRVHSAQADFAMAGRRRLQKKTKKPAAAPAEDGAAQDVLDYARYLGIDPQHEPQLLWIAQEGFEAPLPGRTAHPHTGSHGLLLQTRGPSTKRPKVCPTSSTQSRAPGLAQCRPTTVLISAWQLVVSPY